MGLVQSTTRYQPAHRMADQDKVSHFGRPDIDEFAEQVDELTSVVRDVAAGVVADIYRTARKIRSKATAEILAGTTATSPAGAKPRAFSLDKAVQEHHQPARGRRIRSRDSSLGQPDPALRHTNRHNRRQRFTTRISTFTKSAIGEADRPLPSRGLRQRLLWPCPHTADGPARQVHDRTHGSHGVPQQSASGAELIDRSRSRPNERHIVPFTLATVTATATTQSECPANNWSMRTRRHHPL
jgi:hypothetical protein